MCVYACLYVRVLKCGCVYVSGLCVCKRVYVSCMCEFVCVCKCSLCVLCVFVCVSMYVWVCFLSLCVRVVGCQYVCLCV